MFSSQITAELCAQVVTVEPGGMSGHHEGKIRILIVSKFLVLDQLHQQTMPVMLCGTTAYCTFLYLVHLAAAGQAHLPPEL